MANKPYTKQELNNLICEVMGLKSVTPTITKQINNFVMIDNMTWKEIARCIVWYQEVFHGKFEPIYGLSFVPSVRDRAAKYFEEKVRGEVAKKEQAKKIVECQQNNIIFNIQALEHKKRKPRQLDVNEINVEGDSDND